MAEQRKQTINNVSNLLKVICISDILLVYIDSESDKYYLRYYPKSKSNSFYTGIKTETKGAARKKLVHLLKLIKKAQTRKTNDDFLVIIDNDAKLLSEVDFANDEDLITGE